MQDVVNRALRLYLDMETGETSETTLAEHIEIEQIGRFRLPVIRSSGPGKATVSVEMLKAADDEEDQARHDAVFGR